MEAGALPTEPSRQVRQARSSTMHKPFTIDEYNYLHNESVCCVTTHGALLSVRDIRLSCSRAL